MSFSLEIKRELTRIDNSHINCMHYELSGMLRAGISLKTHQGRKRLLFVTENASLSRHLFSRVKDLYQSSPELIMLKTRRFHNHNVYMLEFSELLNQDMQSFLNKMGISINETEAQIQYYPIEISDKCCVRAYLRGCFLATGSISDPDRSYHLEVSFANELLAEEYINYLKVFDVEAKQIKRKRYFVVYLKEGQDIVDFLNVIGAHNALMKMENIRIIKDVRNQVNRLVNCETANLEKTVNASLRHVDSIRYINGTIGIEALPGALREIASLRLENPDKSLSELGKMLNPNLSKSGVNHRLKKIDKIADELRLKGQ